MQLIFNDLPELHAMINAMGFVHCTDLKRIAAIVDANPQTFVSGTPGPTTLPPPEVLRALVAEMDKADGVVQQTDAPAVVQNVLTHISVQEHGDTPDTVIGTEPTKRKRRTKAEIEAEKAAAEAAAKAADGVAVVTDSGTPFDASKVDPLDNLKPEPEPASATDQVAAKVEIMNMVGMFPGDDKLAHLNEGRAFIEAHGFPTYNETLQLADVPANIAAHTPEQVSRHRAAMAWLAAAKTKG